MSSRLVKKDNIVFLGLPKNGSQAIKQIYKRNDGFEILEIREGWNTDNFIDFYNKDVIILFPMRTYRERGLSELLERAIKFKYSKSDIEKIISNGFRPRFNYFDNIIMEFFITNILFNENWNGCRIVFFDLKKLTTHIPKYIGMDIEIPYYNTVEENPRKKEIKQKFKELNKNRPFESLTLHIPKLEKYLLDAIRNSKYWSDL